jgi:hypothetical protein
MFQCFKKRENWNEINCSIRTTLGSGEHFHVYYPYFKILVQPLYLPQLVPNDFSLYIHTFINNGNAESKA